MYEMDWVQFDKARRESEIATSLKNMQKLERLKQSGMEREQIGVYQN